MGVFHTAFRISSFCSRSSRSIPGQPPRRTSAHRVNRVQLLQVHGFVSPGFLVTTGNNYLAKSKGGSFEFNEVGINFTIPITDKLRAGMQLFAHYFGPSGTIYPKIDWFYLDYRFEDWLGFRAGRVRYPSASTTTRVTSTRRAFPSCCPQSVYPVYEP